MEGNNLKIYDPYLYNGKFTTASRKKANVKVQGNTVYVSVENFKKYANCKSFFSYKYDTNKVVDNKTTVTTTNKNSSNSTVKNISYKARVNARIGLNIRSGASIKYKVIGGYAYNVTVTITKESNGWGKTNKGWICLDYIRKISSTNAKKSNTTIAQEVIQGKWGNGQDRKNKLTKVGYNYNAIQAIVDKKLLK